MADWRTLAQRLWFLPLAATILWWTVRLSTLGRVSFETGIAVGALVNFALLILVVFLQDRLSIPDADFIGRLKSNMKPAVIYACLAAISLFYFAGLLLKLNAVATADQESLGVLLVHIRDAPAPFPAAVAAAAAAAARC